MLTFPLDSDAFLAPLEPRQAALLCDQIESHRAFLERYSPWVDAVVDQTTAGDFLRAAARRVMDGTGVLCGIFDPSGLRGGVHLEGIDSVAGRAEMDYWLAEDATGRGFATQALSALLDYAVTERGLHRIEMRVCVENTAHRSVAERLGFSLDGVLREALRLRGRHIDVAVYSLLGPEWITRRQHGGASKKISASTSAVTPVSSISLSMSLPPTSRTSNY
jgi:ribosomal-protein-serine acetyltransferase